MDSGHSTKMALVAGLAMAFASRAASAQHSCDGVRLELSNDLSPEWREAGHQLRAELTGSDAPCVSATLLVEPATGGAVRLSATTPDGRHTERVLANVATLVPTALGIVASLPPDPPRAASASVVPVTKIAPVDLEANDVGVTTAPYETAPQVWVGANAGGRIAAPTLLAMMDLEGRVDFEKNRWLVVASFRYGTSLGESAVSTDDSYYELVGSLGGGRRFPIGSSSLDVVLSPAISSASLNDNDDDGPPGAARTAVRVGASACWWIKFEDGSRVGLVVDTDLMPYGLFHGVRSEPREPPVPAWTAGLQLGAAGRIL